MSKSISKVGLVIFYTNCHLLCRVNPTCKQPLIKLLFLFAHLIAGLFDQII